MSLKDYQQPKRDWSNKQWLDYCSIHMHNPWINEEERSYYKDKFNDLILQRKPGDYNEQSNKEGS